MCVRARYVLLPPRSTADTFQPDSPIDIRRAPLSRKIDIVATLLTPRLRTFVLTAHVTSSVGWLGAVAGFLALAIAGLTSHSAQTVRAMYLAMEITGWCAIVPLAFASQRR